MKKINLWLWLFLSIWFSACSGENREKLYLYNWSDYMGKDIISGFEKETGIKVVLDYFDSNEAMFAKLKAGAQGYDITFPTTYMVEIMRHEGMLEELDKTRLKNLGNLDPAYLSLTTDPNLHYALPYMVSATGIGYLESKLGPLEHVSWDAFANSRFRGKMTMLNDIRETLGAALKYLGYSYNSVSPRELEEAGDLLIDWKGNLAKFENDQYKNGLASGEFFLCHGYSGDILQYAAEREDLRFIIPDEGSSISIDNMVILKSARNKEAAYAFLDYMLRPEVAAANMEALSYLAPNKAAYPLVSQKLRENPGVFLPANVLDKMEILLDPGKDNPLYYKVWEEVKAAE